MPDKRPTLDLDHYVPYFLAAIGNAVSRGASRLYLKEFGIGIIDWRVLSMLAVEPDIMANRICTVVSLDKAAVSRSLSFLVQAGYAAANPSPDPRRQSYALTPAGFALHDRVMAVALQREKRLIAGMSRAEVETLLALLGRMHANVAEVNRDDYEIPPQA